MKQMEIPHRISWFGTIFIAIQLAAVLASTNVFAGSATWNLNPTNGDWTTAANWTPAVVPNGARDTATFSSSTITDISFSRVRFSATADSIVFDANASAFSITLDPGRTLTMVGGGVVNDGAAEQNFITLADSTGLGTISFEGRTTAGANALYTCVGSIASATAGGTIDFHEKSAAGSATFVNTPGTASLADGGFIRFFDNSTAEQANFTNQGGTSFAGFGSFGGATTFFDTARAAEASFTNDGNAGGAPGQTVFAGDSSADHAAFINNPATKPGDGGITLFSDTSSAGNASLTNNGSAVSGAAGGRAFFNAAASADKAIFVNQGAVGVTSLFAGARTEFVDSATAARSTITANGGTNGGVGAVINFSGDSDGGTARIILAGNGNLDVSGHNSPGLMIGSVEGDGNVFLGALQLSIGANPVHTTVSGLIQDGGEHAGTGGSILKLGPGSLTLTNANTYTGGTTVSQGSLVVSNDTGSATGTGAVQVDGGALGGSGRITGEVTVGTGSGTGARLAPSAGTRRPTTLRLQSALTFKADATYAVQLYPQSGKADQVTARGVTIEDGAEFSFVGEGSTIIAPGTVFFLIKNTAATPIAGNFINLVDGSTIEHAGNNFHVSYEGGDGNDLTLTVLP